MKKYDVLIVRRDDLARVSISLQEFFIGHGYGFNIDAQDEDFASFSVFGVNMSKPEFKRSIEDNIFCSVEVTEKAKEESNDYRR